MRWFGLTPDQISARGTPSRPPASLTFSVVYGAVGFGAVSVIAYSLWAFRLIEQEIPLYSAIAAIYLGLTGIVLSRLVHRRGAGPRFSLLFAAAFLVYAAAWCAAWFGLRGKHHADLWGAATGLAAMVLLLRRAFGKRGEFLPLLGVLFLFHSLGYYLGDVLYATVRGTTGRLLWGAAHGLGFGAGLGYVLFRVQSAPRET
jgi:hypothetical protein